MRSVDVRINQSSLCLHSTKGKSIDGAVKSCRLSVVQESNGPAAGII